MGSKSSHLTVSAPSILISIQQGLVKSLKMAASLLKILLQSKRCRKPQNPTPFQDVVILGNGPSAKDFLAQKKDFLQNKAIVAVNYFAKYEDFSRLRPTLYILADPAFFLREEAAGLFNLLHTAVNWPLTLMIPSYARKHPLWKEKKNVLKGNSFIKIIYYNMTKIDGPRWFIRTAISKGWGLPAPRNVLVPAIAQCLRMGFHTLYLAGADHSWLKLLWVNDQNEVMIDDKHFYDSSSSHDKDTVHKSAPLHITLESLTLVLKSYIYLDNWAQHHHVRIVNITPGSYIDVFERQKI